MTMHSFKRTPFLSILLAAVPILLLAISIPSRAQILSHGDLFGPGAPPPLAGVELGFGQHAEIGAFDCQCGSQFTGGTGTGFIGSLFFELPIDYEWAVGIKGGIDFKNIKITTNQTNIDTVIFNDASQSSVAAISDYQVATIKTTYLDFAPYVQYQFYRMGPFVQAGLDFGFLMASSVNQNRELPSGTTVTQNGQQVGPVTFTNGTLTENIFLGSPNALSLRLGLLLSAGYNIQVSERSIFSPLFTYDLPLTASGTTGSTWRIGSLYFSGLLKFQL